MPSTSTTTLDYRRHCRAEQGTKMLLFTALLVVAADPTVTSAPTSVVKISDADWPAWRGARTNGIASSNQQPPLEWSVSENIAWRVKVPGRGHGSPTVVGDKVFLATGDRQRKLQSVLCYARGNGDLLWETVVHRGGLMEKNKKSSEASSTPACDGQYVYINFLNDGAVYTTALDMKGTQVWQTKLTDYVVHQGYGSSPTLYKSLLLVSADNKQGGVIAALSRRDGEIVWRRQRPKKPNYPSPVVVHAAGHDQLIMTGCDLVTSLNPLTGETIWETEGATTECVTSTVTDGHRIFTSGGYPENHVSAVRADGSGKVEWENGDRVYVPSMVLHRGILYAALDAGIAACWNSETGEELWKHRLGGTFSSSLVMVGDRIYASNEEGTTFVFRANPEKFELLAKNKLGHNVFATPTICGSRLYMRVAYDEADKRQEYLFCVAY